MVETSHHLPSLIEACFTEGLGNLVQSNDKKLLLSVIVKCLSPQCIKHDIESLRQPATPESLLVPLLRWYALTQGVKQYVHLTPWQQESVASHLVDKNEKFSHEVEDHWLCLSRRSTESGRFRYITLWMYGSETHRLVSINSQHFRSHVDSWRLGQWHQGVVLCQADVGQFKRGKPLKSIEGDIPVKASSSPLHRLSTEPWLEKVPLLLKHGKAHTVSDQHYLMTSSSKIPLEPDSSLPPAFESCFGLWDGSLFQLFSMQIEGDWHEVTETRWEGEAPAEPRTTKILRPSHWQSPLGQQLLQLAWQGIQSPSVIWPTLPDTLQSILPASFASPAIRLVTTLVTFDWHHRLAATAQAFEGDAHASSVASATS